MITLKKSVRKSISLHPPLKRPTSIPYVYSFCIIYLIPPLNKVQIKFTSPSLKKGDRNYVSRFMLIATLNYSFRKYVEAGKSKIR